MIRQQFYRRLMKDMKSIHCEKIKCCISYHMYIICLYQKQLWYFTWWQRRPFCHQTGFNILILLLWVRRTIKCIQSYRWFERGLLTSALFRNQLCVWAIISWHHIFYKRKSNPVHCFALVLWLPADKFHLPVVFLNRKKRFY